MKNYSLKSLLIVKVFKGLWPKSQISVTINRVVGANVIYSNASISKTISKEFLAFGYDARWEIGMATANVKPNTQSNCQENFERKPCWLQ